MSNKKVVVKYSGLGPVSVPFAKGVGAVCTIKPGVTEIDPLAWADMKKQPDIAKMLERGLKSENDFNAKSGVGNLVVVSEPKKTKKGKEVETETEGEESGGEVVPGNQKDAKKLVSETEDTGLLRKWLDSEERAGVKNSIEKKLKEIEDYREEQGQKEER